MRSNDDDDDDDLFVVSWDCCWLLLLCEWGGLVCEEGDGADDATLMMVFFLQFVNQPPFALSYSLASSLFSFAIYASTWTSTYVLMPCSIAKKTKYTNPCRQSPFILLKLILPARLNRSLREREGGRRLVVVDFAALRNDHVLLGG